MYLKNLNIIFIAFKIKNKIKIYLQELKKKCTLMILLTLFIGIYIIIFQIYFNYILTVMFALVSLGCRFDVNIIPIIFVLSHLVSYIPEYFDKYKKHSIGFLILLSLALLNFFDNNLAFCVGEGLITPLSKIKFNYITLNNPLTGQKIYQFACASDIQRVPIRRTLIEKHPLHSLYALSNP